MDQEKSLLIIFLLVLAFAGSGVLWLISLKERAHSRDREKEMKLEILKASILRELTRRIGYTFDVHQIIEVISGSLREVVRYQTVSYLLYDEEKQSLTMKIDLDVPVGDLFIKQIKENMSNSLSALCDKPLAGLPTEELVVGAVPAESLTPIASYFNLPLIIGSKPVGLINISSTEAGLYKGKETELLYSITSLASQTVQKLSEVIEREERRVNALVRSLPSGLIMIDADERVAVANQTAKSLLGFADDEKLRLAEISKRLGNQIDLFRLIDLAIKSKETSQIQDIPIGSSFFTLTVYPVTDTSGDIFGSAILLRDISAEKALAKMREEYSAMMVHELRSPLTNIRWAVESVLDESRPTKKNIKEPLTMVENSVKNLLSLVNDLLDVAKIEQGKLTVAPQEGDISKEITEKIAEFSAQASEKNLELKSELPAHPLQLSFDAGRIGQVLNNFLSNAIKFTETGSVTVRLSEDPARRMARINVVDTGPGISPDDQKRLFQKFIQVGTEEAKRKGTGLGLVIAKGIIEAHGGQVGVESTVGQGSTFWFELPLTTHL